MSLLRSPQGRTGSSVISLTSIPLVIALALSLAVAGCSDSDTTSPLPRPESIQLTTGMVSSLDSTAQIIVSANPANGTLKSLVDSTLLVFTAGVTAKRLDVSTNLTSAPMYFVGVHRVVVHPTGSFSTWNVVGMDDPSHLVSLMEVSGYASSSTTTAPTSVSGTIGDGSGIVNGLMMQVGNAGALTDWRANSGTVAFTSGTAGTPCPGFVPAPNLTCAIETTRMHFTMSAASGSNGATSRQASIATDVDVPTMRLTYVF